MTNFFCLKRKSEHFLLLKKKRAILILRSSKRARHRPTRPTMRDAHVPFSHFSPNTPRKSRFGECFGLQPPLLVGGSSRRPIPFSATLKEDAEDEEKRTKNADSPTESRGAKSVQNGRPGGLLFLAPVIRNRAFGAWGGKNPWYLKGENEPF